MNQYLQVAEEENEEPIELPSEEDGTLLLSTLSAQFPGSCGLKYRNPDSGVLRGIRLADGRLHPPDGMWGNHIFYCVFPKENKRKGEEGLENPMAKTKRVEKHKCSDLIVLGLPWKSTEDDLQAYFCQFGELLMVQVKRDLKTGQSKGFGFVRFADYEAQLKCLAVRHMIDGRWCDVRIPNSREGTQHIVNRKVFIGRCTEDMTADDLRSYFNKFGEVVDVFIPKPFRAFAFVTFADPEVAHALCGEDHIIKGASVHVSNAAPKSFDKHNQDNRGKGPMFNQGPQGFSGGGQGGNWGAGQQGKQAGGGGGGGQNMNSPMGVGLGNLGAAFQLNPAMVAAAQAALSQGGWGPLLGMMNPGQQQQQQQQQGNNASGEQHNQATAAGNNPPTGGSGFGNIGGGGNNSSSSGGNTGGGGFLGGGWNNAAQGGGAGAGGEGPGSNQGTGAWGHDAKPQAGWN